MNPNTSENRRTITGGMSQINNPHTTPTATGVRKGRCKPLWTARHKTIVAKWTGPLGKDEIALAPEGKSSNSKHTARIVDVSEGTSPYDILSVKCTTV